MQHLWCSKLHPTLPRDPVFLDFSTPDLLSRYDAICYDPANFPSEVAWVGALRAVLEHCGPLSVDSSEAHAEDTDDWDSAASLSDVHCTIVQSLVAGRVLPSTARQYRDKGLSVWRWFLQDSARWSPTKAASDAVFMEDRPVSSIQRFLISYANHVSQHISRNVDIFFRALRNDLEACGQPRLASLLTAVPVMAVRRKIHANGCSARESARMRQARETHPVSGPMIVHLTEVVWPYATSVLFNRMRGPNVHQARLDEAMMVPLALMCVLGYPAAGAAGIAPLSGVGEGVFERGGLGGSTGQTCDPVW